MEDLLVVRDAHDLVSIMILGRRKIEPSDRKIEPSGTEKLSPQGSPLDRKIEPISKLVICSERDANGN